jgi:hypothetical protein
MRLPVLEGRPIRVSFLPELTALRGKLLSRAGKGNAVYAGSDIRKRTMVLDSELASDPSELERILFHEIHHFIWVRLGNPVRFSYEALVAAERSRGELGWSSESLKVQLTDDDRKSRSRLWRDYVCESFCDTGAWLYSSTRKHEEWTLAGRFRTTRKGWFREFFVGRVVSI